MKLKTIRGKSGPRVLKKVEERTEKAEVNTHVPPAMRISDVEWQEELVSDLGRGEYKTTRLRVDVTHAILAIPARRRIIWIVKVAACSIHEITRPGRASLAGWRIEPCEFFRPARDLQPTAETT